MSGIRDRVEQLSQKGDATPAFKTDPVRKGGGGSRFTVKTSVELSPEQHRNLNWTFREYGISGSSLIRACLTKLANDPALLKEIQELARDERA